MSKPRVFIGSSTESLRIAQIVKNELDNYCECVIWNDNFFDINRSTYENIIKKTITFDYAVFIGGKDDFVIRWSTRKNKVSPRDNVYLEFGLYTGILSPSRTFFMIDKKCKVATDLYGITLLIYSCDKDVQKNCSAILKALKKENNINRIQLLPSTSLAIGYYENFLSEVGYALFSNHKIVIDEKEYDIKSYDKELQVCIPTDIISDWKTQADVFFKEDNYKKVTLKSRLRDIGIILDFEKFNNENKVVLLDCPQTLRSAFKAVEIFSAKDFIGANEYIHLAKKKEVGNFIQTIENLTNSNEYIKKLVKIRYF